MEFGKFTFRLVLSSWLIVPLIRTKCPSLSLLMSFSLNSILSDFRIARPFYFWVLFWVGYFGLSFYSKTALIFKLRCASWIQKIDGFCLLIHPACLCTLEKWGHWHLKLLLTYMLIEVIALLIFLLFGFPIMVCILITIASCLFLQALCYAYSSHQPQVMLLVLVF